MLVGVVGLAGVARVLEAGSQLDQLRAPGVEPDAERATAGGGEQVRGDRLAGFGERRRGGPSAPASGAGCGRRESKGVARVVVRDVGSR